MKVRIKREDWYFYLDPGWHKWQEAQPWHCIWNGEVLVLRSQLEIKENKQE